MARKGTAAVKKTVKWVYSDDEDTKLPPPANSDEHDSKNRVQPALKRSNEARREPQGRPDQPRQEPVTVGQSHALAESLFTKEDGGSPPANDSLRETPQSNANNRNEQQQVPAPNPRAPKSSSSRSKKKKKSSNTNRAATSEQSSNSDILFSFHDPDTMIQGGAFIPPNQQRNMRACMVCSIVRTQQQFTTQGCPNCEDVLELAGNPEQVNDCTSQVFEGIITIADTTRSWVARYQRLEGYVPGVYATQVEGILPEEVLVAVENAGINYVPRDGSEQEMLGKE